MKETKVYSGVECDIYSNLTEGFVLDDKPLVTVSVTAYNSSKFVLETLESIKAQTYHNLILQISDDCSKDNTIEVCKNWIDSNQNRFYKTKIITPRSNTGVSANCNRAWDECETEWFKGIAGDDLLLPYCVEDCVNYVSKHLDIVVLFGKINIFGCSDSTKNLFISDYLHNYEYVNWTKETMIEHFMTRGNFLPAAAAFHNIYALRKIGIRHDERIPLLEDLPKWINCLDKNAKFGFLDKEIVGYRMHDSSLSNGAMSPRYNKSRSLFFIHYVYAYVSNKNKRPAILAYLKHYAIIKNNPWYIDLVCRILNKIVFMLHKFKNS